MNILVMISKYMKNDAARISAIEYSAILTHENYVGVSSVTGGLVVADLNGDASIEDMKEFVTALIAGDANLLSVHLSDLNFKHTIANSVQYSTSPELTPEELRALMPDKTPREFRDILIDEGILTDAIPDEVTVAIQAIPYDKERTKALNAWHNPTMFSRSDPYIDMIGAMFNITPDDIDILWNA